MQDKDILRIWTTFLTVLVGIGVVVVIFNSVMSMMQPNADMDQIRAGAGMAGTAIAMVGTLVGFVTGQAAGATGKEKADERAKEAIQQAHDAMNQMTTAKSRAALLEGMSPQNADDAWKSHPELFPDRPKP
jgi:hypothetical protein